MGHIVKQISALNILYKLTLANHASTRVGTLHMQVRVWVHHTRTDAV